MATLNDRVSDIERDRALQALGVHYAQGRINVCEYEQRSELAMGSTTKMELDSIFLDLPMPHYDRGLSVVNSAYTSPAPTSPQVEKIVDPWDQPINNGPLTLRKVRRIGWLLAVAWIFMLGPVFGAILPDALIPFFTLAPALLMLVFGIVMKPNVPRYRVVSSHHERGRYPY